MKYINKNYVKKILVLKLRGMGDVILSTIILENLRIDFPDARIDYLTEKPSKEALQDIPQIDNILLFDRKSTWERLKLFMRVRKEKYDLILDLFSNPSTAQLSFLSGARYRAGFPYKGRKYAYNIYGPVERDQHHSAELHLEFLRNIGLSYEKKVLHFGLNETSLLRADEILAKLRSKKELLVCISPSGGWPSKKCDPSKFAEIATVIHQKYNASLFILWGPGDKAEAVEIKRLLGDLAEIAPGTSIKVMGAILSKCDAVVANDSGPMHISTAVGTPTLSMHGPTNPKLQGPYGNLHEWVRNENLECIECNLLDCPKNHECFLELSTDLVLSNFNHLLLKNNLIA
ncbi:MAG: glycosyltransferase family 9 protein [Bacteroidetes bacterium]|nr:glycosyltransferase family 9 protein [Bacteroidota bacterium]